MYVPPPPLVKDKWVVIFDTNALIEIWKYYRSVKSIFNEKCEVVIPHHVMAELDYLSKKDRQESDTPKEGNIKVTASEIARNVALDLATYLPKHMRRGRIVTEAIYRSAKREAEVTKIDDIQRSVLADNRILIFVQRIFEIVTESKAAEVLFVTNDKLMSVSAYFQLGCDRVSSSNQWESIMSPTVPVAPMSRPEVSVDNSLPESVVTDPDEKLFWDHVDLLGRVSEKEISKKIKDWEEYGLILPDRQLAAYCIVDEREKMFSKEPKSCTNWNGPNGCCFHELNTGKKCHFEHRCLFCGDPDHGWYSADCQKFDKLSLYRQRKKLTLDEEWRLARPVAYKPVHPDTLPTLPSANISLIPVAPIGDAHLQKPFVTTIKEASPTSPKTVLAHIVIKLDPFPANAAEVEKVFTSHEQQDKLKPLLKHIKRLAFGRVQDSLPTYVDASVARYWAFKQKFENTSCCVYYNSKGCTAPSCKFLHSCLYCGANNHGWAECQERRKLELFIVKDVYFQGASPLTPLQVVEHLVLACVAPCSAENKPEITKFVADMKAHPKEKLLTMLNDRREKGFYIPYNRQLEFASRLIAMKKNACLSFNTGYCDNGDKCTYQHLCAHCGDTSGSHSWCTCERRLELYFLLIGDGKGVPDFMFQ